MNEKSGANNSVPKAPAANSSYEVENNVAKTSEAEISKGTSEDGGSSAGTQTKSLREQNLHPCKNMSCVRKLIHESQLSITETGRLIEYIIFMKECQIYVRSLVPV